MPTPSWTAQYNTGLSPEGNGFSRTIYNSPIVTEVTSGNPANRRVEINSNAGSAVFLTSQVPSLDSAVGVTAEADIRATGIGDAGLELTFLDAAVLLEIYETRVDFSSPGMTSISAVTPNNGLTTHVWRFTFDGSRMVRIYRDGILVIGPAAAPLVPKPFQRVLWWGEDGGVQTFFGFRYFIGGAVAPG